MPDADPTQPIDAFHPQRLNAASLSHLTLYEVRFVVRPGPARLRVTLLYPQSSSGYATSLLMYKELGLSHFNSNPLPSWRLVRTCDLCLTCSGGGE